MKQLFLTGCIFLSTLATGISNAENPYIQQNMQGMMEKMQGMQNCMMELDQDALTALGKKAQQVESELSALCKQGNNTQARTKAMDFAQSLKNNPQVIQAQDCLKDMPDMMQGHVPFADLTRMEEDYQNKDICSMIK